MRNVYDINGKHTDTFLDTSKVLCGRGNCHTVTEMDLVSCWMVH